MTLSVKIICDGNAKTGYGHVRRSTTLAQDLIEAGHRVSIEVLSDPKKSKKERNQQFNIHIFDTPAPVDHLVAEKKKTSRCVGFDYFGKVTLDLAVNVYPHKKLAEADHIVTGHEYIIIRSDIRELRNRKHKPNGKVTIVLGGGDILNCGRSIANALADHGLNINLIEGPYSRNQEPIKEKITLFDNPANYAELIAGSHWNVTNGGSCLFESVCLGKAVWVVPQTEAEQTIASWFYKKGVILGHGENLKEVPSPDEILIASKSAHNFIDGLGTSRIINLIEQL